MVERLYIFDMDDTLIAPPDKAEWERKTGKKWPFKRWWTVPESLITPFPIHAKPKVKAEFHKAKQDPKGKVVIMTGRINSTSMQKVVKQLLTKLGFGPLKLGDNLFLKKVNQLDTGKWKSSMIAGFKKRFPQLKSIKMWDDRKEHLPKFRKAIKSAGLEGEVIHVPGSDFDEDEFITPLEIVLEDLRFENVAMTLSGWASPGGSNGPVGIERDVDEMQARDRASLRSAMTAGPTTTPKAGRDKAKPRSAFKRNPKMGQAIPVRGFAGKAVAEETPMSKSPLSEYFESRECDGRQPNNPWRTPEGPKKFAVCGQEGGETKLVRFGDPDMEIKRDDAERRKNFRARHGCDSPGPKTKAKFWACKTWEKGKTVSDVVEDDAEASLADEVLAYLDQVGVREGASEAAHEDSCCDSCSKGKTCEGDQIPGGKGDKLKPEDVDPEELKKGIKVELEHTKDKKLAQEIALDHLAEDPKYYTKLAKIHHEATTSGAVAARNLSYPGGPANSPATTTRDIGALTKQGNPNYGNTFRQQHDKDIEARAKCRSKCGHDHDCLFKCDESEVSEASTAMVGDGGDIGTDSPTTFRRSLMSPRTRSLPAQPKLQQCAACGRKHYKQHCRDRCLNCMEETGRGEYLRRVKNKYPNCKPLQIPDADCRKVGPEGYPAGTVGVPVYNRDSGGK